MTNVRKNKLNAPHIRTKKTTQSVMLDVIIALLPSIFVATYFFGLRVLFLTLVTVSASVLSEYVIQKSFKKKIRVRDLSAIVTGMLIAMNLPARFPFWMAIIGAIFAIVVVKEIFGGIGQNFMNPALAARVLLLVMWPAQTATFTWDGVASATPLSGKPFSFLELFIGQIPGSFGEVSKLAILIGLAYLLYRNVVNLRMPIAYILTCAVLLYILKYDVEDTIYQLMSGGIIFAAAFMITDYSTSPMSPNGQYIYAIGAGVLTVIIRLYGGYPEGVSFAIIIMNVFVPLIDKYVRPRVYGIGEKDL